MRTFEFLGVAAFMLVLLRLGDSKNTQPHQFIGNVFVFIMLASIIAAILSTIFGW